MTAELASQLNFGWQVFRRQLLLAVVFLLLGAVVNVAVAWGCALFALYDQPYEQQDELPSYDAMRLAHAVFPEHDITAKEISGRRYAVGGIQIDSITWHNRPPPEQRPRILRSLVIKNIDATAHRSGWPLACLWGYTKGARAGESSFSQYLVTPPQWISDKATLPTKPLWIQFTVNTAVFGSMLFAVWLMSLGTLQWWRWRRIHRGLCPKCAYPVGERDFCTECGAAANRNKSIDNTKEPSL